MRVEPHEWHLAIRDLRELWTSIYYVRSGWETSPCNPEVGSSQNPPMLVFYLQLPAPRTYGLLLFISHPVRGGGYSSQNTWGQPLCCVNYMCSLSPSEDFLKAKLSPTFSSEGAWYPINMDGTSKYIFDGFLSIVTIDYYNHRHGGRTQLSSWLDLLGIKK